MTLRLRKRFEKNKNSPYGNTIGAVFVAIFSDYKTIASYLLTHRYDYTEVKEALKAAGLLTVEYTGKTTGRMYDHEPYTYGHGWVVNDLPESVLEEIKSLLQ